jgi:hypothetical protein
LAIKDSGHVMRGNRRRLTAAAGGEFKEDGVNDAPSNFTERVTVEEKKGSGPVALQEEIQSLSER